MVYRQKVKASSKNFSHELCELKRRATEWGLGKLDQEIKKLKLTFNDTIKQSITSGIKYSQKYLVCKILIYLQCAGKCLEYTERDKCSLSQSIGTWI